MPELSSTTRRVAPALWPVALLSIAYFLAAAVGIYVTREGGNVAAYWPANALLLGVLLRARRGPGHGFVLGCVAANFFVNLLFGASVLVAAGFVFCNMAEVGVATVVLRRVVPFPWRLRTSRHILAFGVVAGLLAPLFGAGLGAALVHNAYGTPYWDALRTWWVADAMGLLLVTPVILTASRATFARLVAERGTELAAMLVATAGVTLVAFSQQHFPLLHVVTPLLLWSAFRLGTFVTAAAALAVCSLAVAAALYGVGPIAELASGSTVQPTQFLHLFFSVEVLIPVVVALLTGERQGLIEELEQKNTELERFAYTVSHDLKGPLVTVEGFLSHLKHDLSAGSHEDIDEDMAEIERATRNMGELLTDLLELSRRGVVANRNDTLSMATILDDVLGSMSGAASVAVSVPAGLPPIRGDRGRLGVVIRNIVDNAQKFARDGQPAQLTVTAACGPDSVEFFFRDNGIGVAEEDLERVFELFQRLDSRTTGTGVGLAIVQRTVEAHGGKVWVESEGLNQGTTVVIRLPHGAETTATGADLDPRGHALGLAG